MLMQRCPEKEGQRPAMVPLGVAEGAVQGNRTQRGYLRLHNAACQACGAYPDCVIHRMYESGLGNTKKPSARSRSHLHRRKVYFLQ